MKTLFSIDGVSFPHIRVLNLEQTFEILDGENSGRTISGLMRRDIIGTYYNYKLSLKPDNTPEGMNEYNQLWELCSCPTEGHDLKVPYDIGNTKKSTLSFRAYITSGKRDMLKYDVNGVDYWNQGEFQFIALRPKRVG